MTFTPDDIKILLIYAGMLVPAITVTVAAGILYNRQRAISTSLFLGGSIVATLMLMTTLFGAFYFSKDGDFYSYAQWSKWLQAASFVALLVQAIGIMIYAVEQPKVAEKNTG